MDTKDTNDWIAKKEEIISKAQEAVISEYGEDFMFSHWKDDLFFFTSGEGEEKQLAVVQVVTAFRAFYLQLNEGDIIGTM